MKHFASILVVVFAIHTTALGATPEVSVTPSKTSAIKTAKSEIKKSKKKSKKISNKSKGNKGWSDTCDDLLDSSVKSTLALEKSFVKKKKKISREQFDEKVHNELLVVQLNAWVCAVSSKSSKGASLEEQFFKDFSSRVQNRKL